MGVTVYEGFNKNAYSAFSSSTNKMGRGGRPQMQKPVVKPVQKSWQKHQEKVTGPPSNPFMSTGLKLTAPAKANDLSGRPKVKKGDADDQTCWDFVQTGKCPRFPCKWQPCCNKTLDDPCFADARVSKKYLRENGMDDLLEEENRKDAERREARKEQMQLFGKPKKGDGKKGSAKGKTNQQVGTNKFQDKNTVIKPAKKVEKGAGKVKKEKTPLVGPNGEEPDDMTCWDVKQTGFCKRFPCKWQPCCELPRDDPIFSKVVDKPKRSNKGGKGKGRK